MRHQFSLVRWIWLAVGFAACAAQPGEPTILQDQAAPTVSIDVPTAGDTYLTNQSAVTLSGTAADNGGSVARVQWSSSTGASGTASGTAQWTITDLALTSGMQTITVTAYDQADNSGTDAVEIRLDDVVPILVLSGPTSSGSFNTVDQSITISGEATDDDAVDRIEWSADDGQSGSLSNPMWEIPNFVLGMGETVVTLTAYDVAGNTAETVLTITRFPTVGQPHATPGVFLTNTVTSVRVTFQPDPEVVLTGAPVTLVEVDADNAIVQQLVDLLDDGNPANGDEILADGVYSGLVSFSEIAAKSIRLQVSTTIADPLGDTEGRSQVAVLNANEPIGAADDQIQKAVQDGAATQFEQFLASSDVQTAIDNTAQWLGTQDGVTEVTTTGTTTIEIVYASGLKGGMVLTQDDSISATKGGMPNLTMAPARALTSSRPALARRRPGPRRPSVVRVPMGAAQDTIKRRQRARIPIEQQTVGAYNPPASFQQAGTVAPGPSDVILNRKVLLYAPYEAVFGPKETDDVQAVFAAAQCGGYQVTYLKNQDATVAALFDLTDYGFAHLSTHGQGGNMLLTGEIVTPAGEEQYEAYRSAGQVQVWTNVVIDKSMAIKTQEDVFGVSASFIAGLPGKFPNSVIINSSCESTMSENLANAFLGLGAGAYFGFSKVVWSDFSEQVVQALAEGMVIDLKTTGDAFTPGVTDPKSPFAVFERRGRSDLHYPVEVQNGDFEFGNLGGWTSLGDGRVITQLASLQPTGGQFMGIVSTGLGFTTSSGAISQCVLIGSTQTELTLNWNFLSEEFLEYVGSQFQDFFRITVRQSDGTETVVFERTIDQLAAQNPLLLVSPGIVFDQGDVYMTDWQALSLDMTPYQGQTITLIVETGDVGDSIYDTAVLFDDFVIQ